MGSGSIGDRFEVWLDAKVDEKLRDGKIMLDVLQYLIVFLTCFVIGTLLLRILHTLRYGRRDSFVGKRGWMSRTYCAGRYDPHALSMPLGVVGSRAIMGGRRRKDQMVNDGAVSNVRDTRIII
jgi:hypothetical protein